MYFLPPKGEEWLICWSELGSCGQRCVGKSVGA
jgi:hypothetical protein